MVENEEDFTADFLNAINMKYLPDQVFIEYNGTWEWIRSPETELPRGVDGGAVTRPWMRPPLICIGQYAHDDYGTGCFRRTS